MTAMTNTSPGEEDFITIIAPSMAEVMASFAARGACRTPIRHRPSRRTAQLTLAGGNAVRGRDE